MHKDYQYTTLICSLPAYESLLESKQPPISRIQLNNRLKLLDTDDASDLDILNKGLDWHCYSVERSDEDFLQFINHNMPNIKSDFIKKLLIWRLELRAIVALLRRRYNGDQFKQAKTSGYGRWLPIAKRHWEEPGLGLEKLFPWVLNVQKHLASGDCMALEQCIFSQVWSWLDKKALGHEFDFPAVAIYCMRWSMLARWTANDKTQSMIKFKQMVTSAMGEQSYTAALH